MSASRAARRSQLIHWTLALALVTAQAVWLFGPLSQLGFLQDDYLNFSDALDALEGHRSAWRLLYAPVMYKFVPLHRALHLLHYALWPMSWNAAVVVSLCMAAAVGLAFHRLCRTLWGPSAWNLVLLAFLLVSPLWMGPLRWWGASAHILPALFGALLSLDAFVRYVRSGRRRDAVLAALFLALGLGAYEKAILTIPYALLLHLLVLTPARSWRSLGRELWRCRAVYFALGVVALAYVIHFFNRHYQPMPLTRLGEFPRALWWGWSQTVAPALLGASGEGVGARVGNAVAWSVILVSLFRAPSAWRAWALFAFHFVVGLGMVSMVRISEFGAALGLSQQYMAEGSVFFLLSVGLSFGMFLPARALPRRATQAAAGAALGVAAVLGARTLETLLASWPGKASRPFVEQVRRWTPESRPLLDGEVPAHVLEPWYYPRTLHSHWLRLYDRSVTFAHDGATPLAVNERGALVTLEQASTMALSVSPRCLSATERARFELPEGEGRRTLMLRARPSGRPLIEWAVRRGAESTSSEPPSGRHRLPSGGPWQWPLRPGVAQLELRLIEGALCIDALAVVTWRVSQSPHAPSD